MAPAKLRPGLIKILVFAAVVLALLALDGWFGWSRSLAAGDLLATLSATVDDHPVLAALIYVGLSVVGSVALALPGVLFAIAAGTVFGPWAGTLLCWVAMVIGAALSFLVGRYFLKDGLKPRLARYPVLDRLLFSGADRSDLYLLALTRLIPIFPFNIQNFAYGITDMAFGHYVAYSALFILPGTAAYTLGAAGLVEGQGGVAYVVVAVALIVASLLVARVLKKKESL